MPAPEGKRLFRFPYVLSSRFQTTGDGTEINQGAIAAGDARDFPQEDFSHNLDRPLIITHFKVMVGRVSGGDTTDSDYENILINIRDLVRNEDITKDPVPLSVLHDIERRIWMLHPGNIIIRKLGGGLKIRISVNPGAVGAPYNIEYAAHGYLEEYGDVSEGMLPANA
jgi:hypothetical protein